jgi:alpha-galactosidase
LAIIFLAASTFTLTPASAQLAGFSSRVSLENNLAQTPPMGWNSWYHFAWTINESIIREQADAMASNGMMEAGYQYINIDDCWQGKRDAKGNIQSDPQTFPSGIKALADYVHSKGLKLGLYTDAGRVTCEGRPGSGGHVEQDAQTYAQWGVDYLKEDWCHTSGLNPKVAYREMGAALINTGRPIVFSLCDWGVESPWLWGAATGANLWRTTGDTSNKFSKILAILHGQIKLAPYAGPSHWNDPDGLEVGNGMSQAEDRAQFSLWAILAAPLIAGNDLSNMSQETLETLTAPEVIAVDQDPAGIEGTKVQEKGQLEVWSRPLQGKNARAVVILNRGLRYGVIAVNWRDLGLAPGAAAVRDLWEQKDLGSYENSIDVGVDSYSALMIKVVEN